MQWTTIATWRARFLGMALLAAAGTTGCIRGVGAPCTRHLDCEPGLACGEDETCTTCGDGVSCVSVELVVRSCDTAVRPLDGVTELQFRIEGEELPTITTKVPVGAGKLENPPQIPPGKKRRVFVDAVEGARVVSRGASGYFDVDLSSPPSAQVVFLRRKGQFSPVNSAADPDGAIAVAEGRAACQVMTEARAGHTSTLLPDGRILIAGGYRPAAGKKEILNTVEIYDPRTGTFTRLEKPLNSARYGHVATLLPDDGRVFITGGIGIVNEVEGTLVIAELFDPAAPDDGWAWFRMRKPRMDHAASVLPNGVVLISGGKEHVDHVAPMYSTEEFNSRSAGPLQTEPGKDMAVARGGHTSVTIGADKILVVGGTDGTAPLQASELYQYVSNQFVAPTQPQDYSLNEARAYPLAVELVAGADRGALVLGNIGTNPDRLWDWFSEPVGGTPPVREIPTGFDPKARKQACVARFDGAGGTGAVVVGGRLVSSGTTLENSADLFTYSPGVAATDSTPAVAAKITVSRPGFLSSGRAEASCATLADGSVLVTGGVTLESGSVVAKDTAEVLVP